MIISGVGELHLDVITSKLKSKFGVGVDLVEPKVAYRETIRKKVKVEGKHKKTIRRSRSVRPCLDRI